MNEITKLKIKFIALTAVQGLVATGIFWFMAIVFLSMG